MRYQSTKNSNLLIAVLILLYIAFLAFLIVTDSFLNDAFFHEPGFFWFIVISSVYLLANAAILSYHVLRTDAYAMIEDDGIHVFSKKGELAFVPWTEARDCRQSGIWTASACMLVFRYDMTCFGKPLATYTGFPHPKYKEAKAYLLDKLIIRLARGKMTAEEFRSLPVLFLVIDDFKKDEFKKMYSMWRAAKNRAVGEQEKQR